MRTLTRRRVLGLGLGAVAAGMVGGCSTPGTISVNSLPVIPPKAPGEKITLTYWAWLKDLQKVADIWNAANPDIQVQTVPIPGGNAGGYQKMYSALAAGGGPDLAQIEIHGRIPDLHIIVAQAALNGLDLIAHVGQPLLKRDERLHVLALREHIE